MRKYVHLLLECLPVCIFTFALFLSAPSFANAGTGHARVTYVASEAVYINVGLDHNIKIGDSLAILHKSDTVAILIVTHVSQKSSACDVTQANRILTVGDRISLKGHNRVSPATPETTRSYRAATGSDRTRLISSSRKQRVTRNTLSGSVSFDNLLRRDLTGSGISSNQIGFRSNITVKNIQGSGLNFEMRQRSRFYHRSRYFGDDFGDNAWAHHLFAFGISYGNDNSPVSWGIGRMLAPHVRGMGYIDGGYFLRRVNKKLQIGIAAGATPNAQTSQLQFSRRKLGVYAHYVSGAASTQLVSLTASLTSVIESFTVSRDFLYLQSGYSRGRWLSLSQSFEVEINRSWRYKVSGKRFDISDYYGSANINLMTNASVYFTYDARRNIRRFDNAETPDSLFDSSTHRGIRAGFRLRTMTTLRLYGSLGVRLRQGAVGNNTFGSIGARINRLPRRGHSLALNMSYVKTQFTTGYRPNITYRFPLGRLTRVNLSVSSYVYTTVATSVTNLYLDVNVSRELGTRYFITGSYRQYFDGNLQSGELYTEIGLRL